MNSFIQIISLVAYVVSIYSVSVVDNTTAFYSLNYHEMAPPAKVITYSGVDRLVST